MRRLLAQSLVIGTVLAACFIPYFAQSRWRFMAGTAVIVGVMGVFRRSSFVDELGLRFTRREFNLTMLFAAFCVFGADVVIEQVLGAHGLSRLPRDAHPMWVVRSVFQVMNEEMVFRALLLGAALKLITRRWVAALLCAALFALAHGVLYALLGRNALTLLTVVSLFCFGWALNNLFLHFRTIGVPLAIHVGWNLSRFGWLHRDDATGTVLSQGETFNRIEGSGEVVALSLILVGLSFALSRVHRPAERAIPPQS